MDLVVEGVAGHQVAELATVDGVGGEGADFGAVAQNGDALGDLEDLVETMADENDADAGTLQLADQGEQRIDLVPGQGGRRLVHDDELGIRRQARGRSRPAGVRRSAARRLWCPDRTRPRPWPSRSAQSARIAAQSTVRRPPRCWPIAMFSATVRLGNSESPGRSPECRNASIAPDSNAGSPGPRLRSARRAPAPARPEMILISVDLPEPFSPTRQCTSPACSVRSTLRSAWTPPKRFEMPDISRNGVTRWGLELGT